MTRMSGPLNRINVIDILEKKHNSSRVITENICHYMESTRRYHEGNRSLFSLKRKFLFDLFLETKKILPPEDYYPDGRFNHNQQIHERLNFLK